MSEHLTGQDRHVSWSEARTTNQAIWDERAVQHEEAYEAAGFADDPAASTIGLDLPVLMEHLPADGLNGQRVLHLQCHIGLDTLSLAREGASVTGLDFSADALEVARRTTRRAGLEASWVQSDALAARDALEGEFDVVFTGIGAVTWLADLGVWAEQIASLLRPGGIFYIRDGHPMLYAMDETSHPFRVRNRYFANGTAQTWDDPSSYMEGVSTSHVRTYEFPHALSEIIGSLLRAGLVLERFDEGRTLPWRFAPCMERTELGWAMPAGERDLVPLTYTLVARKPR